MKKASETNEVEILDEAYLHHGGESSWGAFGSQRMSPRELIEASEEGQPDEEPGRGAVLMLMLDFVLAPWGAEECVEKVGKRMRQVGAAMSHAGGRGLPLLGVRTKVEVLGGRDDARRILDWLYHGDPDEVALGKKVVAVGKFLGHSAFDGWSMSALGRACGETPQAMQERTEVVCEDPLRRSGSKGKAVWQQPEWQREKSREAQKDFYEKKKSSRKRARKRAAKKSAKPQAKKER